MRQKSIFESAPRVITYSQAECFQECRVKWDYRYNKEIVPAEPQTALSFGTAIHAGLEFWFKYGTARGAAEAAVDAGARCGLECAELCKVQVLIEKYAEIYKTEQFEVVDVERVLRAGLRNPRTGRLSRTFVFMGKADALVRTDGGYYILEHKTTSDMKQQYLDALGMRPQTALYAMAYEEEGIPIRGVIYDIIEKPGIKMGKGETEEEFEARKAALLAKSKTGTTKAQRKEAETPDEYMARLREKVTAESFKRMAVEMDITRKAEMAGNLWKACKDMRRPEIYPNRGACCAFGKVCEYMDLCLKGGDMEACGERYKHRKANSELEEG